MNKGGWKVGELARATGLTVRTLHHYDEIGLLKPSGRTPKGHRVYGEADVARLQQVTSLRQLGFGLDDIAALLDRRGMRPREVVHLHLHRLREQIQLQRVLCDRLEAIAARLDAAETVSADELILTIEATTMYDKYYTPEQLDTLKARADEIGPEGLRAAENDWATLMAEVRQEMDAGTDPSTPRAKELAGRWMKLVSAFTGGDAGISDSLKRMWSEETSVHGMDTGPQREMMAWVQRALAS